MPKTVTLTNILANDGKGYFSATRSNISSWATSTEHPDDGSTGSAKVTPAAAGECTLTSKAQTLVASHKYYLSFQVMTETALSASFDWYFPVAEPVAARFSGNFAAKAWTRLSTVFTRTQFTDGSYPCRWDYNNEGESVPVWLSSVMLFDLTAAFGAGNEPSEEWLDTNITSFGDSVTVQTGTGSSAIQIFADSSLVYDSRLEDYELIALKVTSGLNKGGSATITMPPKHPAYSSFVSFKTIVTIYRNNVLVFRGRALYPSDDFYNQRTIVCEGELCFFEDAVCRPYLYQNTPANVFAAIVADYNSQVETAKRFTVGEVTVTDNNDYIRLESEKALQTADVIEKLIDRCGGYIVFSNDASGNRVINWYAERNYHNTQTIEFGENLLDFSRSANTDIATRIIPYGAKDETTGERITIASVNNDIDYVEDADAVALRGVISKAVYWDDVTLPANLLAKAQQYLASSKMIVTALELTAVDLSAVGESIDDFRVGDNIHVISKPHSVDDWMLLEELTLDLLNPADSEIKLGKSYNTLTGADVSADRESRSELQRVEQSVKIDTDVKISETTKKLYSEIETSADSIKNTVSETYVTKEGFVTELNSTELVQTVNGWSFNFDSLKSKQTSDDKYARDEIEERKSYIQFEDGNIILGKKGNPLTLKLTNNRISFLSSGAEVAYINNDKLYITGGEFLNCLTLGNFGFFPRENGNLSFKKVK